MKQTAVEWLVEQLKSMEYDLRLIPNTIKQAKEMEKEQIIQARDSFVNEINQSMIDLTILGESKIKQMTSEQYYNQTFKS